MVEQLLHPFITLCDYDAPLRLRAAGFKTTTPHRRAVWSLWHPMGCGTVDFDLTTEPGVVRARVMSDDLDRVVGIVEGSRHTPPGLTREATPPRSDRAR